MYRKESKWPKYTAIAALVVSIIGLVTATVSFYRSETALQESNNLISEETQIRHIIDQEASFVVNGQTDKATSLYADNAIITDAHGGDSASVEIWSGKDEIAKRYASLPHFAVLQHTNVVVIFGLDKTYARAIADTVGNFEDQGQMVSVSSNQGEKWTFEKTSNDWKIVSFTYNLP